MRVAAFFDCCRDLAKSIPELRIRTGVRPTVWSTVKVKFESLSHIEQYTRDLTWNEDDIRQLLARRIEGYLDRTGQLSAIARDLGRKLEGRDRKLIALVFRDPMPWKKTQRPPHSILCTLSKNRPRWVVELARISAQSAHRVGREEVDIVDISSNLHSFGKRRKEDTVAEYTSQCAQVGELIDAFENAPEQMDEGALLRLIDHKVLEPSQSGHLRPYRPSRCPRHSLVSF